MWFRLFCRRPFPLCLSVSLSLCHKRNSRSTQIIYLNFCRKIMHYIIRKSTKLSLHKKHKFIVKLYSPMPISHDCHTLKPFIIKEILLGVALCVMLYAYVYWLYWLLFRDFQCGSLQCCASPKCLSSDTPRFPIIGSNKRSQDTWLGSVYCRLVDIFVMYRKNSSAILFYWQYYTLTEFNAGRHKMFT